MESSPSDFHTHGQYSYHHSHTHHHSLHHRNCLKIDFAHKIKWRLPLPLLWLFLPLLSLWPPTARSVSGPSWGPVLQPQLGMGSPSGPVGQGASSPGGPGAPWSPFLPLFPFLPPCYLILPSRIKSCMIVLQQKNNYESLSYKTPITTVKWLGEKILKNPMVKTAINPE